VNILGGRTFEPHEYAIQEDHVKVDVQVQRRAEALEQGHGARVAGAAGEARRAQQVRVAVFSWAPA